MSLYVLMRPFVGLCVFRIGPQSLPSSALFLGLTLSAHALVNMAVFSMILPAGDALFAGLVDTAILSVLTTVALYTLRRQLRLVQTLTAMAGAVTVLHLCKLPFSAWLSRAHDAGLDGGIPLLILLVLTGWTLTVQGHILRHALSSPLMVGLMLAMLFFAISDSVMQALFPLLP